MSVVIWTRCDFITDNISAKRINEARRLESFDCILTLYGRGLKLHSGITGDSAIVVGFDTPVRCYIVIEHLCSNQVSYV